MTDSSNPTPTIDLEGGVDDILKLIDQEREREIITRRFGLYDRKETLEQIGELLGITRERVRQLEKSILTKLKTAASEGRSETITKLEKNLIRELSEIGRVARAQDLADKLYGKKANNVQKAHVFFVASIAPGLLALEENDNYYSAVAIADYSDDKDLKKHIDEIVNTIKVAGEPQTVDQLFDKLDYESPKQIEALATISKKLAQLKNLWGLAKWPTVNPKNIRDKIYVILSENAKPMHFSEISKSIKNSSFKRKDVTTQAIHNELIKDKRFVLIGRGIYALKDWGYSRGTVSDIIEKVLKNAKEPLHRDEIVKRVLRSRQVKETTILLNLQSKPQFKRVAKATYTLVEE